jgi:hypothetical protein
MALQYLNIEKQLRDALGQNEYGINQLRNVEWGKKYLWSVRFMDEKPPAPFNEFFPATDITIPEAILENYIIEFGQDSFKIPHKTNAKDLSITFFDDSKRTLLTWFKNWVEIDILNNGQYVSCLLDDHLRTVGLGRVKPVREIEVFLMDNSNEKIKETKAVYKIIPEGTIEWSGSSASEIPMYTVNFSVVDARFGESKGESSKFDSKLLKKRATQLLGRFF